MKKVITLSIVLLLVITCIPQTTVGHRNNFNNHEEKLDNYIKLMMKIGHMPSLSTCIVKNNEIVWENNYGKCDIKNNKKPSNSTIYDIGSITKSFIAISILQLYENELISLDDNVSNWLPFDLKNPNYPEINITFRMLLSHQSSRYDVINGNPNERYYRLSKFICYTKESFEFFRDPPYETIHEWIMEFYSPNGSRYDPNLWGDYQPGTKFSYSNDGYIILGYLIEKITCLTFEEYVQENILDPLEMNNTSFNLADLDEEKLAVPYYWIGGIYFPIENYEAKAIAPCGGLKSTIGDLSKYLCIHLNNGSYRDVQILKNETMELMHSQQVEVKGGQYYGFGWFAVPLSKEETLEGHTGGVPGFQAAMWMYRNSKVGVIMLYNNYYPSLLFRYFDPFELFSYQKIRDKLFSYATTL